MLQKIGLLIAWVLAHWDSIALVCAGGVSFLGTLHNLLTKKPRAASVIGHIVDVLAWVSRPETKGLVGRLSIPLLPSRPITADTSAVVPPRSAQGGFVRIDVALVMLIVSIGGIALAAFAAGCATPSQAYVTAQKFKGGASDALFDTYAAWRKADVGLQDAIRAQAKSFADYQEQIARYRTGVQAPIDGSFASARDAVTELSKGLAAADAVKAGDFSAAIGKVLSAFATLVQALQRYHVNISVPSLTGPSSMRAAPAPPLELLAFDDDAALPARLRDARGRFTFIPAEVL